LYQEIFVNRSYDIVVPDCKVIIDFGSNTGVSILRFKTLYPDAKVLGFEPSLKAYGILKNNLESNNISGVVVSPVFVSDQDGDVRYDVWSSSYGNSAYGLSEDVKTVSPAVDVSRLITGRVDIVKMDIERSEYPVLKRLLDTGKLDLIRNLIIEFHDIEKFDFPFWFNLLSCRYDPFIISLGKFNAGGSYIVVCFREKEGAGVA
jgi:FkbM family methyltransferase